MSSRRNLSNLELVARVDTWPYYQKDPDAYKEHMKSYHYFLIDGYRKPFRYIHSSVVPKVSWGKSWTIDEGQRLVIFKGGDTFDQRCQRMEATLRANPKEDDASAFGKWCEEQFPVYDANGEHVLDLDGAGVDTLGIVNYACHMIAFVMTKNGLKYWVPRRAKAKCTYPDVFDNTV